MQDLRPTFEKKFPQGSKGGQCAAFAEKLVKFGPVGDSLASKLAYVKKFGSTNIWDIQVGDVVLTNDSKINGHIFVVNCDKVQYWQVTESNFDGKEHVSHTRLISKFSNKILGHIRAPLLVQIPAPTPMTHKLLILKSNTDIAVDTAISKAVDLVSGWINQGTNGEFVVQTDILMTDRAFNSVPTPIESNGAIIQGIIVDPLQIANASHNIELANNKEYDLCCLIYNPNFVTPDKPTNPVHSPKYIEGFTTIQIPRESGAGWDPASIDIAAENIALTLFHEMNHAWPFIINTEGSLNVPDKTHAFHTNPEKEYFLSLLLELKPYWNFLINSAGGKVPMLTYKFSDNPTEYILTDDATLVGVTAAGLAKVLAGRPEKLVVLAPSERAKYTVVSAVVN